MALRQGFGASVAPYCILHQRPMIALANDLPPTTSELLAIKGIGKIFVGKYGEKVLEMLGSATDEF